jgi:TrmH family RNA methyltransferase
MTPADLELLRSSLINKDLVFLDGFHAVKHAARFGADIGLVACANEAKLQELAGALAPDIAGELTNMAKAIDKKDVKKIGEMRSHWTGVWGVAARPKYTVEGILYSPGPVVLLENPQNGGNIGACIRVAAAASAAGVLIVGGADPWEPAVIRGAAGLQFAIPIANLESLASLTNATRPIIAIDPEGADIASASIPNQPILAFGTEREGLSDQLTALANTGVRLPMKEGVSSVNLAVAVGIVLYSQALSTHPS